MSTATDQREEPTQILAVVDEELAFAFRIVLCAFYACWWRIKHYLWFDPKLNRGAKNVAAGSGLVLFLDVALFFFHEHMAWWLGGVAVKIVYIPAIKYMHGIIVGFPEVGTSGGRDVTYGLKRRLYVEIDKKYETFASILSLPVTSPLGIHGILNIDTKMSDAFNSEDIHTLTPYAETIGLGISLCHK